MSVERRVVTSVFPPNVSICSSFLEVPSLTCAVSEYHIGVDEAGRGPSIGPMVVCALSIPKSDRDYLLELGVDDSKRLSKKRRESIYDDLISNLQLRGWGLGLEICNPSSIDKWMADGTLNSLEVQLFAKSINIAGTPSSVSSIFLDACDVNSERFGRNVSTALGRRWGNCKIQSEHKMDSKDPVVGAASIIAKVSRDEEIRILSEKIGVELGSGYPSDQLTKKAVDYLCSGESPHDVLRWSWANVRRSWTMQNAGVMPRRKSESGESSQSTLGDWK